MVTYKESNCQGLSALLNNNMSQFNHAYTSIICLYGNIGPSINLSIVICYSYNIQLILHLNSIIKIFQVKICTQLRICALSLIHVSKSIDVILFKSYQAVVLLRLYVYNFDILRLKNLIETPLILWILQSFHSSSPVIPEPYVQELYCRNFESKRNSLPQRRAHQLTN